MGLELNAVRFVTPRRVPSIKEASAAYRMALGLVVDRDSENTYRSARADLDAAVCRFANRRFR